MLYSIKSFYRKIQKSPGAGEGGKLYKTSRVCPITADAFDGDLSGCGLANFFYSDGKQFSL